MRTALIPPITHLHEYGHGSFHLLLAHLLKKPTYKKHYRGQRKLGAYLVLDNSAHEMGKGQDPDSLIKLGFELDAQEIVVPDVLDNAEATVEACLEAHESWFESSGMVEIMKVYDPAFMYVPQGKTEEDWIECLDSLFRIHYFCSRKYSLRRDMVLGISKDYDGWDGGLPKLLREYVTPRRDELITAGGRIHVHMLGWPRDLLTLQKVAEEFPWIRSTDSAKPFVYALQDLDLLINPRHKYPGRDKNYFTQTLSPEQKLYADHNIGVFESCARGEFKVKV